MNSFHYLHTLCLASPNFWQGSLLLNLFLGGLVGGFTHCTGMCSPFVMFLSKDSLNRGSGILWPYHLGRISVYAALGTISAFLSSHLVSFPDFKLFSSILLIIAGSIFLLIAFGSILPGACALPAWVAKYFGAVLYKDIPGKIFFSGLLLGFIPCGLVYAALLAATATGNPALALGGMVLFGLGTMPALMTVGIGCRKIKAQFTKPSSYGFKILSIFNAFLLFVMAGEQIT